MLGSIGFVQERCRLWMGGGRKFRITERVDVGQYPTLPATCQLVILLTSHKCLSLVCTCTNHKCTVPY